MLQWCVDLRGASVSPAGVAFKLRQRSTSRHEVALANGWTTQLIDGSRIIVARASTGIASHDDALEDGIDAAQEALDLVAMAGPAPPVIEGVDSEHAAWWLENGDSVLRLTFVNDLGVGVTATATVTDAAGRDKTPPPPPTPGWHPSFRYFRLSQASSDLFDAYRNLYLALESALSSIVPMLVNAAGRVIENEGVWLRRALTAVHPSTVDLARYAAPGTTDPVQAVYDDIYAATRTAVFHAKAGRPVLLPHGFERRSEVAESLERLARLYLDLAKETLGVSRPTGVVTYQGFARMVDFDAEILVSDDASELDAEDLAVNPAGGATVALGTRRAPELARPGITFWLGELTGDTVRASVDEIRRVGLTTEDGLFSVSRFEEDVTPVNIDRLQVAIGVRLVNTQAPVARFAT